MRIKIVLLLISVFFSCKDDDAVSSTKTEEKFVLSAVDISTYPEIRENTISFFDTNNKQKDFLEILKENNVNVIRLRLWVNPKDKHSGFEEVKEFSNELKNKGFKILITVHYSDTWADPSRQETPENWKNISFEALKDSVANYTKKIISEINPEYIQVGNEINSGFLHPQGNINSNPNQFKSLLNVAISSIRNESKSTKIILHYAGLDGSDWFYSQVKDLDYDIIGLSYYPIWHGKDLQNLENTMLNLETKYDKDVFIAETAYPFTLEWNDWTNNVVGLESQLILPEFPATEKGQKEFLTKIKQISTNSPKSIGFCYWGAELISWKGNQSENGSSWENQALFDFNNKALPAITVFQAEN